MSGQDRETTQIEKSKDVSTKVHPFSADLAVGIAFRVQYGGVVMHQHKRNKWPWSVSTWGGSGMSGQDRESSQTQESKDVSTKIHPFGADLAVGIVFPVRYGGFVSIINTKERMALEC